jgi:hypothetical protein
MITEASKHNIDLAGSYFRRFIHRHKCGLNAETKAILVLKGYGKTAYRNVLMKD